MKPTPAVSTLSTAISAVNSSLTSSLSPASLLATRAKTKQIWNALLSSDIQQSGVLGHTELQLVFKKVGSFLQELLQVRTPEELLGLLDEDEDGQLNQDEQLLLFSVVKERLQAAAYDFCHRGEFYVFKDLLSCVRALELDIRSYHTWLSQQQRERALTKHRHKSETLLVNHQLHWKNVFLQNKRASESQLDKVRSHYRELARQSQPVNPREFKFKPEITEFKVQRQLLGVCERPEEAEQLQRQLAQLEAEELARRERIIEAKRRNHAKALQAGLTKSFASIRTKGESHYLLLRKKLFAEQRRLSGQARIEHEGIRRFYTPKAESFIRHSEAGRFRNRTKAIAHYRSGRGLIKHERSAVQQALDAATRFYVARRQDLPVNLCTRSTSLKGVPSQHRSSVLPSLTSLYNDKLVLSS